MIADLSRRVRQIAASVLPQRVYRPGHYVKKILKRLLLGYLFMMLTVLLIEWTGEQAGRLLVPLGAALQWPVTIILRASGFDFLSPPSVTAYGVFAIFFFFLAWALAIFIPLALSYAWGAKSRVGTPEQPGWAGLLGSCVLALVFGYYAVFSYADDVPMANSLYVGFSTIAFRTAMFYVMAAAALMCVWLAWARYDLLRSLRPPPETANVVNLSARKKQQRAEPAPPPPTPSSEPAMKWDAPVDSFYVALAAELIQFSGFHGRAPQADELAKNLLPLQRAARMSKGQGLDETTLNQRCDMAAGLFAARKLAALQDVKAAKALFTKPKPGAVETLARELALKLA